MDVSQAIHQNKDCDAVSTVVVHLANGPHQRMSIEPLLADKSLTEAGDKDDDPSFFQDVKQVVIMVLSEVLWTFKDQRIADCSQQTSHEVKDNISGQGSIVVFVYVIDDLVTRVVKTNV